METEQERRDDQAEAHEGDGVVPGEGAVDDAAIAAQVDEPAGLDLDDAQVDTLAGSLLWRIGHAFEDGPVTVRVGLASAAPLFADLPRLRAATDQEVEAAIHEGDVLVEWVGPRLGGRS